MMLTACCTVSILSWLYLLYTIIVLIVLLHATYKSYLYNTSDMWWLINYNRNKDRDVIIVKVLLQVLV